MPNNAKPKPSVGSQPSKELPMPKYDYQIPNSGSYSMRAESTDKRPPVGPNKKSFALQNLGA